MRLAVGQVQGGLSPDERLDWLRAVLPGLASGGTDLLVLPELFANGYNCGPEQLRARAEPADGPFAAAMAALARQTGVALHYGFAERDAERVLNSAQCFGPDGARLGGHRKLAIPPGFERDVFEPGQGCMLFTWRGITFATLICYDAEFNETARHVAAAGAQVILVPTALGAGWPWVARSMIPVRAYENGVFLAYANSAGTEAGLTYLGESLIAAPDGCELARAGAGAGVICADLDMARVAAAQTRLPYLRDRLELRLT
ncbi:MAG: carbon-nitrogen hydrolase family protein [Rhodobacteraceae bacterium]|nr:carbon-nitrogen hydrolase family protein [Paracoccaceae bacterium]